MPPLRNFYEGQNCVGVIYQNEDGSPTAYELQPTGQERFGRLDTLFGHKITFRRKQFS